MAGWLGMCGANGLMWGGGRTGEGGGGGCTETPRGSMAYLEECISDNRLAAICRKSFWTGKLRDVFF